MIESKCIVSNFRLSLCELKIATLLEDLRYECEDLLTQDIGSKQS